MRIEGVRREDILKIQNILYTVIAVHEQLEEVDIRVLNSVSSYESGFISELFGTGQLYRGQSIGKFKMYKQAMPIAGEI